MITSIIKSRCNVQNKIIIDVYLKPLVETYS